MFEKFKDYFSAGTIQTGSDEREDIGVSMLNSEPNLAAFFRELGGISFGRGLYRTLKIAEIEAYIERTVLAFPDYRGRIFPFGYDWLNRVYCLDIGNGDVPKSCLLFSHLSDEVLRIPAGIVEFHNDIIINDGNEIFDADMFDNFLIREERNMLGRSECAGIIVPLFLGGEYSISNMDLFDTSIDWETMAQILVQTRASRINEKIQSVSLG